MKIHFKRKIGDFVEDTQTGFKGTIVALSQYVNGCARATVQPRMKETDTEIPQSVGFDLIQLKLIEDVDGNNDGFEVKFKANFGDTIEDMYTGYRGKVVGITFGEYRKNYIAIGRVKEDNKMPEYQYITSKRCIVVERAASEITEKGDVPGKTGEHDKPGGPSEVTVKRVLRL